jgi:hypothetical protein
MSFQAAQHWIGARLAASNAMSVWKFYILGGETTTMSIGGLSSTGQQAATNPDCSDHNVSRYPENDNQPHCFHGLPPSCHMGKLNDSAPLVLRDEHNDYV